MLCTMDLRQLATVLAALRHYQLREPDCPVVRNVATVQGTVEPLSCDEIDELCEMLKREHG